MCSSFMIFDTCHRIRRKCESIGEDCFLRDSVISRSYKSNPPSSLWHVYLSACRPAPEDRSHPSNYLRRLANITNTRRLQPVPSSSHEKLYLKVQLALTLGQVLRQMYAVSFQGKYPTDGRVAFALTEAVPALCHSRSALEKHESLRALML